jgi:DtxR family Mn-dependent transcriptional regulator
MPTGVAGSWPMSSRSQYLLVLYIAEHREEPPISSGPVAEALDCSPATVSEMFRKLEEDGLVAYEPYEGAVLTEVGREEGARLHETYVLLSWFFRSVLDLDDHEQEAMEMAGIISRDVADQLVGMLPHGDRLPDAGDVDPRRESGQG